MYGLGHSFIGHSFYMSQPAQSFVFYVSYYIFVINCFISSSLCATNFRPVFYIECQPTCRPCFIPQNYSLLFCFTYFLTCHLRIMLIIYGLFARFCFVLTVCALSFVCAFRQRVPSPSLFRVCRMRPLFSRNLVFSFTCALASVIVFPLAKHRFNTETASYTLFRFLLDTVFRRKCVKLQDDITQVIFERSLISTYARLSMYTSARTFLYFKILCDSVRLQWIMASTNSIGENHETIRKIINFLLGHKD
jgi:hypothetical protein